MSILAQHSLAAWCRVYAEITQDSTFYTSNELEIKMWSFFCAEASGVVKQSFKIPFENVKKSKLQLPYLPEDIKYSGCVAIKKNGGLYTPCCGKVKHTEEGEGWGGEDTLCVTCKKAEIKIGTINNRDDLVEDGTIKPITYGDWMKAHKLTLSEVYAKLAEHGVSVVIPDKEQAVSETAKKARRGRPGKSDDSVVDEDGEPEVNVKKEVKKAKAVEDSDEEVEVKAVKVKKAKVEEVEVKEKKEKKTKKAKVEEPVEVEVEVEVKVKADKVKKAKVEDDEPKSPKSDEEKEAKAAKKAKKAAKAAKKAKDSADDLLKSMDALNLGELNFEEGEIEKNIVDIDGKDYESRNGFILNMEGEIVGREEEDEVVWTDTDGR